RPGGSRRRRRTCGRDSDRPVVVGAIDGVPQAVRACRNDDIERRLTAVPADDVERDGPLDAAKAIQVNHGEAYGADGDRTEDTRWCCTRRLRHHVTVVVDLKIESGYPGILRRHGEADRPAT